MSTGEVFIETSLSRSDQVHAVTASFLGWTLDAFDFFVLVFLVDTLAAQFHVPASKIILTITATLAMRPLGALLFGLLADRYGRRGPLMANVVFFSVMELACGFAPNYTVFFVLRAIFGIGMGGEWGVGASLAMESVPARWRGVLSARGAERIFRSAICWRPWRRGWCCRCGDGGRCFGWAGFRRCWRSTSGFSEGDGGVGSSIGRRP